MRSIYPKSLAQHIDAEHARSLELARDIFDLNSLRAEEAAIRRRPEKAL